MEGNDFVKTLRPEGTWSSDKKSSVIEKLKEDEMKIEMLNKLVKELTDKKEPIGRSYRLDPNTPVYHGRKEENVEKWILMVSNNMRAAGVPENKQLYVLTNYVKDAALSALIKY
jgi:hypothetical protein